LPPSSSSSSSSAPPSSLPPSSSSSLATEFFCGLQDFDEHVHRCTVVACACLSIQA
jgi:hypothetical protein